MLPGLKSELQSEENREKARSLLSKLSMQTIIVNLKLRAV
jgi:hypothetical protein